MIQNRHLNGTGANLEALLVTAREAATALSISERTLWGLTAAGKIPVVRIGRAVRYDPRDLQAWIERNKQRQGNAGPVAADLTSDSKIG
jgi:excisionase family DNA binding protein